MGKSSSGTVRLVVFRCLICHITAEQSGRTQPEDHSDNRARHAPAHFSVGKIRTEAVHQGEGDQQHRCENGPLRNLPHCRNAVRNAPMRSP
jgi:hypothetical protein